MLMGSSIYLGFLEGAIHHIHNLSSSSWFIYAPEGQLVSSRGVCLQPSSNRVVEYSAVIELLHDSISNGVWSLKFRLESQLVVSQLNGMYCIKYPTMLRRFLRVILSEQQLDYITYIHIPRVYNHVVGWYANYVLDFHLSHP